MPRRRPRGPHHISLDRRRLLEGGLAVAAVMPALSKVSFAEGGEVNVYNWDTYIGETTVDDFTAATGTEVRYDLFASNDELFAKLREGNPGYDVIFPSSDWAERMVVAEMLLPLDHGKIPNIQNIDPKFMNPAFDRGRTHSLPYFWGTMGIGYRISATEGMAPKAWADMYEKDQYSGRMALLNDSDLIEVTLKYLGYSVNSNDPAHVDEVIDVLIKAKPHIKTFAPDTGQDLLIAGEVDVCMEWNGDILQVMEEDDDLAYIVPEEGSLIWEDTIAIPAGGPNPDNAHAFINYILEAEVHGQIASEIKYACPNQAAFAFIPQEDLDNPAMYPPREVLERCEAAAFDQKKEDLKAEAMTRILAA